MAIGGPRFPRDAALVALCAAVTGCGLAREPVAVEAAEICNGLDDDANGVVDDLDANGDGLCDCLRIGVLGYPGAWGAGDLIRGWMHARAVPTAILAGAELTPELLARLDVVIVQDVRDGVAEGTVGREGIGVGIGRAFSDAEVQALRAWVEGGGGLMTLVGYTTASGETTNVNRVLAPFGLSYGAEHILDPSGGRPIPVTHWNGAHPIASGIQQVGVSNGYPVSGGALVASEPVEGAWDVGRAAVAGRGHVFAWGDEWITYDSEWSRRSDFQVERLWLNALKWLTAAGYCQVELPR